MKEEQRIRYSRMLSLPEIGKEGMERLRAGRIAIVGCGALGSICAMYLAGAGIGELTLCDFDTIDISNLHRQLFYETSDVGRSKAATLAERIKALNPECGIHLTEELITREKALGIFNECDFVIDATDNPSSKFMTDLVCHELGRAYCIGGVSGFIGQVISWAPGHSRYSEIFSPGDEAAGMTPCSVGGVIGPAAGIVACCQASEAIKHLTGAGKMLYNRIYIINLLTMDSNVISVQ